MSWVESSSPSFQCRHSSACQDDAAGVLGLLERTRERLARHYPRTTEELTVILHDSPASLALSNPMMGLLWSTTERTSRRYVTGWTGSREMHVLSPRALRDRASGVAGSYEMLALSPASLYVRRVILECNHDARHSRIPGRGILDIRWSWLLEGASRWFSGESGHGRAVVGYRMRHHARPHFPPTIRNAPLLAPSLIELLAQHRNEAAVAQLTTRLHRHGPHAALTKAFGSRTLASVESDWRGELRRLADGA